jgi:hypothetical protein
LDRLRDPYEGLANSLTLDEWKRREVRPNEMERLFAASRQWTYANSWHLNEFESAAMWELYLKTPEGIALETTFLTLGHRSTKVEISHYYSTTTLKSKLLNLIAKGKIARETQATLNTAKATIEAACRAG